MAFPHDGKKYQNGQTGNPNGRPKKLVSSLIFQLKEEGYERVTAGQVREAYEILINLDQLKIVELGNDKEQPMFVRIIAKAILDKKGFEIIEKMLDRAHGKPKNENSESDREININIIRKTKEIPTDE
jgi:hypothetical protein